MVVFVPAHDMQALPAFQPRFPNGIHGYTNLYTVNPIEQAAKNDTADKSVTGEVKMNQVLLLEIKHKALSLQIAQQQARLKIYTTITLLGLTISL